MLFDNSKWIWPTRAAKPDEYAEFLEEISFGGGDAELYISSDSNYSVYINGRLAAFGQYADFPYMKVYDKIDVSKFMRRGKNVLAIRVWYYGIDDALTYYPGTAGLIFSLISGDKLLAASSSSTLSRFSPTFVPYRCKRITSQLGLSFEYDAKRADAWMLGDPDAEFPFGESMELNISPKMRQRTCLQPEFGATLNGKAVVREGIVPVSEQGMIFDLGKEAVGFICLKLNAKTEKSITVAFGEHLVDGHVRREVGGRDFSFVYHPTLGINYYMNAFRRFGCRYVELITDGEISDASVSLRSVIYPLNDAVAPDNLTLKESAIYDACAYTMQCCMHEHYEDCPWREQALYTMDSRNQMLAGYYAFGETLFPKANLELIAEDRRSDGLLSICYPILKEMAIPSFSLHFILECEEYLRYTDDCEFIERIYPKIESVLTTFLDRINTDGLIPQFENPDMWNFYEWMDGLDGVGPWERELKAPESFEPDLVLNSLLSIAISRMIAINRRLCKEFLPLVKIKERLNSAIHNAFYVPERGLYETRSGTRHFSKLANSVCILAGVTDRDSASRIADMLLSDTDIVDASLSMRGFFYDALIETDKDKYKGYILDEIDKTYTPMLEFGNGTVWETVLGESDFDNAGSLCHGWSAIPINYYHILKNN